MNKKTKKTLRAAIIILVMLLAAAAILGLLVWGIAALARKNEAVSAEKTPFSLHSEEVIPSSVTVDKNNVYALYFNAAKPFSGIEIYGAATTANKPAITITLYNYTQDYPTSVSSKPVISEKFSGYADRAWLFFSCESIPAGEYIITVTSDTSGGIYYSGTESEAASGHTLYFYNGSLWSGGAFYCNILFDSDSETLLG